MLRIAVWGVISNRTEIIRCLHRLSVLHVDQHASERFSSDDIDSLRLLRGKLLGMIEVLKWNDWNVIRDRDLERARKSFDMPVKETAKEINSSLDHFQEMLSRRMSEKEEFNNMLSNLHKASEIASHFDSFVENNFRDDGEISFWWIDPSNQARILSSLRKRISQLKFETDPDLFNYHVVELRNSGSIISLSTGTYLSNSVEEIMKENDAVRWIPPVNTEDKNLSEAIKEERNLLGEKIQYIDKELEQTRHDWGPKLASLFMLVDEKAEEMNIEAGSEDEGHFFMIEGWIPEDSLEKTKKTLQSEFRNNVFLRWRYPSSDEWHTVPTSLSNWAVFRPFEVFLKLMQAPVYKSSDPTPFIALFFPFFSGCMVGDIGYGLVALLIGYLLFRKKHKALMSDMGYILIAVSLWSIFWGFAYGELFGDLGLRLFNLHPLWLERSHAVMPVLVFTVSLGLGHVVIGLLLGFFEGLRKKERHIWLEKAGNLILISGLVTALVVFRGWLPEELFSLSLSLLFIGLIFLIIGGGIGGLVESFGTIGNILSYVRIAAIGLSSAILAVVASKFIDVFGLSILGIFMALSIHLLNFVLAIGGSSLHSARLHYVEFMGKFYDGGGIQYKPFSRRRGTDWKKH